MIMVPVLILQIFLFPIVAVVIMDNWNTANRTLELQQANGHLGSTIQQLYYTVNRIDESTAMQINLNMPQTIEQYSYTVRFGHVENVDTSFKIMNVSMQIVGAKGSSFSLVTLGNDVNWQEGLSFNSTQPNLSLTATKNQNIITLTLEGT